MRFKCGHEAVAGVGDLCVNCYKKSLKGNKPLILKKDLPKLKKASFQPDVNRKRARRRLKNAISNGTAITRTCSNPECEKGFKTANKSKIYCCRKCQQRAADLRSNKRKKKGNNEKN